MGEQDHGSSPDHAQTTCAATPKSAAPEAEPRARELLPNREQIEAIKEPRALAEIADRVRWAKAKIEADLEFGPGDEEWAGRATRALAAHRICLALLEKRIARLTRGGHVEVVNPAIKERAKADKHAAHAERMRAEADATTAKAERERVRLLADALAFARKQSFLAAFQAEAKRALDGATYSRISNAALAATSASMTAAIAPDTPTPAGGGGLDEAPSAGGSEG